MDITQILNSDLGKQIIEGIGQKAGTSADETKKVVSEGFPALLGMLKQNASTPEGEAALLGALKQHDGGILEDIQGFLGGSDATEGSKILEHVLGAKQNNFQTALSKKTGVDAGSIGKILPLLAPFVLGMLGKRNKSAGGGGLGNVLGGLLGGSGSNLGGDILSSVLGGGGGGLLDSLTGGSAKGGKKQDGLGGLFGKK